MDASFGSPVANHLRMGQPIHLKSAVDAPEHPLFMSEGMLFMVVVDILSQDAEKEALCWLDLIQAKARGSSVIWVHHKLSDSDSEAPEGFSRKIPLPLEGYLN